MVTVRTWSTLRGRQVWARAVLVLLLAVGVTAAARGVGFRTARIDADDAAAWLVSTGVGQAGLVDGASGQVITQVRVAKPNHELTSAQWGADAYLADMTTGTVSRLDGATLTQSRRVAIADPQQQLAVFAGRRGVFVVNRDRGVVSSLDPAMLQVRKQQGLASRLEPGGGIVDGQGLLWALDPGAREVLRLDQRGEQLRRPLGEQTARSRLVLSAGRVVVVDPVERSARRLDAEGRAEGTACVDVAPGDDSVLFAPSSASDRVTAVSADRGVMTVTGLTKGSCGAPPVRLGAPGHELGVPQELLGRLFVPDYTDHAVYIVDLGTNRLVAKSDVITKGGRFDLEPRGEFVFYNDATSEDAGVIRLDGRVTRVKKYNPDAPGAGLPSPRPESPSPPSSTPPPRPKPHVPQVAIALSAASVAVDHPVTLRVVATRGQVRAVRWDFGDGTSAAGIQVEHSWRAAGAYPVYATTTLEWDAVVVPEAMVQVTATPTASPSGSSTPTPTGTATSTPPPAGPTVSITASDTTPTAGDAVAFQLTVSGGTARDAYWDFGDTTTTHGLTSSHAWAHEGRYQVFAEVTFADGSKVAAKPIDLIVVAAPTASIEASTTTPLSGQTVDFHLVTSGGTPQTADWTFGTVSRRGLAPSYSWSDPGTYRVTAEVIFANGRHAVAPALTIKVTPACTSELAGHWTNVTTTGGVTKTDIFSSCSGYTQNFSVHVWGACHPSDCDWGTVGATKQSDSQLTAFYDPGFAEENVTLTYDRSSGLLTVTVFTHFTDDSGRADYTSTDTLSRTS